MVAATSTTAGELSGCCSAWEFGEITNNDVFCYHNLLAVFIWLEEYFSLMNPDPLEHQWYDVDYPESKVHGAIMGPTWRRQDPGGPHLGHVNLAIWVLTL